jgi:hypothetical protein
MGIEYLSLRGIVAEKPYGSKRGLPGEILPYKPGHDRTLLVKSAVHPRWRILSPCNQ